MTNEEASRKEKRAKEETTVSNQEGKSRKRKSQTTMVASLVLRPKGQTDTPAAASAPWKLFNKRFKVASFDEASRSHVRNSAFSRISKEAPVNRRSMGTVRGTKNEPWRLMLRRQGVHAGTIV